MILLDMTVSRWPYYLKHVYQSLIYIIVYLIFNASYVMSGETNPHGQHYIYAVLDYTNYPTTAAIISVIVTLIVFPIVRLLLWSYCHACAKYLGVKADGEGNEGTEMLEERGAKNVDKEGFAAAVSPV